jgi:hypothetical protein
MASEATFRKTGTPLFCAQVLMSEADRRQAVTDTDAAGYGLSDAAAVFKFLNAGLAAGHFDGTDPGVISITNVCAIHFGRMAEEEAETLFKLHRHLKDSTLLTGEEGSDDA